MFKNHFISGLCLVDNNFPLHLWCHLLDQAELTLNMLCMSRINPNLSAHEQLHGIHDFNATPLAPSVSRMKNLAKEENGPYMASMGGMSGLHPNIIDVIRSIFQKHKAHKFAIQSSSSQPTAKCQTCQHMMQPYTQQMT